MRKTKNFKYSDLDFLLITLTIIAAVAGLIMISSAVHTIDGGSRYILIQSVAAVIGLVMMLLFATIDYENLGNLNKIIYIANIFLLVLVLMLY